METFKKKCHDYYLLLCLWLVENDYFDEVIVWRLSDRIEDDIIFEVNGKVMIQRWVKNFREVFKHHPCEISFWRGGFKEYDVVTREKPDFFGLKLYLGAGKRIVPQWNGKYDYILIEDERDKIRNYPSLPFYKTASPEVFKPLRNTRIEYDICWPCNFTQIRYKGQERFISEVSKSSFLKSLKIVHCGNKPGVGVKLAKKYGVRNIEFLGWKDREELNRILNSSKFGLNLSNRLDGCPRVSTEILMSGTPLLISEETRLLDYFKTHGVHEVGKNISSDIRISFLKWSHFKKRVLEAISGKYSFHTVCKKNIDLWMKL